MEFCWNRIARQVYYLGASSAVSAAAYERRREDLAKLSGSGLCCYLWTTVKTRGWPIVLQYSLEFATGYSYVMNLGFNFDTNSPIERFQLKYLYTVYLKHFSKLFLKFTAFEIYEALDFWRCVLILVLFLIHYIISAALSRIEHRFL